MGNLSMSITPFFEELSGQSNLLALFSLKVENRCGSEKKPTECLGVSIAPPIRSGLMFAYKLYLLDYCAISDASKRRNLAVNGGVPAYRCKAFKCCNITGYIPDYAGYIVPSR